MTGQRVRRAVATAPLPTAFTPQERRIIDGGRSPSQVQRWLDSIPYNREERGETLRTFRGVVRANEAHCLEGALSAATILEQHGYPPIVLDLESQDDLDHVLFLFQSGGAFGTVGHSRDPGLGGRRPVFRSLRDLVYSYIDPYVDLTGRIDGYGTFDLRTLRVNWRLEERNVWSVQETLIRMPHTRLRTSDARYRRWRTRYARYKERHPDQEPAYYPKRERWL